MADVIASNEKIPAEIKFPQARESADEAASLFRKLKLMDWYHQCLAKSLEFEASLLKTEEGKRGERIRVLARCCSEWKKASEYATGARRNFLVRESEFAETRVLKLEGVELMHELKTGEAKERFQKALQLERIRRSEDGMLWVQGALLEADASEWASNLLERSISMTDAGTVMEMQRIVRQLDGAISEYEKMRDPDTDALGFCRAMRSLFEVLILKTPEAWEEWWAWRSTLPPGIFSPGSRSKRSRVRNIYLMMAQLLRPLLSTNDQVRIKEEIVSKLMILEKELGERFEVLRKKKLEAGEHLPAKPALGFLFDRMRRYLKVEQPPLLHDAYYKVWIPGKHADSPVSAKDQEEALQEIGDSLADETFDKDIEKYMAAIDSELRSL